MEENQTEITIFRTEGIHKESPDRTYPAEEAYRHFQLWQGAFKDNPYKNNNLPVIGGFFFLFKTFWHYIMVIEDNIFVIVYKPKIKAEKDE